MTPGEREQALVDALHKIVDATAHFRPCEGCDVAFCLAEGALIDHTRSGGEAMSDLKPGDALTLKKVSDLGGGVLRFEVVAIEMGARHQPRVSGWEP